MLITTESHLSAQIIFLLLLKKKRILQISKYANSAKTIPSVNSRAAKTKIVHFVRKAWNLVQIYFEWCWAIFLMDAGRELP